MASWADPVSEGCPPLRLPKLQIYRIGYVGFYKGDRPMNALGPLAADEYVFHWFLSQAKDGEVAINGERLHWKQGDLLLGLPGDLIAFPTISPREIIGLLIGFSVLRPAAASEQQLWPRLRTGLNTCSAIPPLLRYCMHLHHLPEPERTTLLSNALLLLVQMFVSGSHEQEMVSPMPEALPRPLAVAVSSLLQPGADLIRLTPRTLAAHAGVTPDHLTRLAKDALGVTIQRLIHLQRLRRACELLGESELTMKEVAHRCGFVHPTYFSRLFLKELDCTPSEYRLLPPAKRPEAALPLTGAVFESTAHSYGSHDLYICSKSPATPDDLRQALKTTLRREQRAYAGLRAGASHWRPVSLAGLANRSRRAGEGWIGFRLGLPELASGKQTIHGVNFEILDDHSTAGRSILMMRSAHLRSSAHPRHSQIPIGTSVRAVAILHACGWSGSQRQLVGEYEAEFANGQRETIPIWTSGIPPKLEELPPPLLQDWWPTYPQFDHATARKMTLFDPANPLGSIRYAYTYLWRNPRRQTPLKAWHIRTTGQQQATLAILALSILPSH